MTAYFDQRANEVRSLQQVLHRDGETSAILDAIDALERSVVEDVSRCAEWPAKGGRPACPEDIRVAIHRTVLLYSTHAQTSHKSAEWVCPDYEDTAAVLRGLDIMISRLHDIFHNLGRQRIVGFSDSPLMPFVNLDGDAEEARCALSNEMRTS